MFDGTGKAISHEEEDRRRIGRGTQARMVERFCHVNCIKGCCSPSATTDYEPVHKDRRQRLEELRMETGTHCQSISGPRSVEN